MRIPDFSRARLLVAGDVMLDRYWYGTTARISPEAPVPVVNIRNTEQRLGGAANVALGLAVLGATTRLLGRVGRDEAGEQLRALLHDADIEAVLEDAAGRPTTTKLRIVSHHQQMIRLDFDPAPAPDDALTLDSYEQWLTGVDAVVLSDYAKGALQDIPGFIRAARQRNLPVLVDPKQRDFAIYRGATVVTPNRAEFEQAVGVCRSNDELEARAAELIDAMDWEALLLTRGEEGMSLFRRKHAPVHIPAQAQEVFDVTGAGDTVIAVLAGCLAVGEELPQAAALANLAAGIAVGKLGTATVALAELQQAVHRSLAEPEHRGSLDREALLSLVARARARGETIVMTNGCFDLLHPGHVAYLEQAKALGDRLVVAVNDDGSARRLKGPSRPINPLAHRMAVLAGLASVDWVVPFTEDTPAALIEAVLPDVLVKGGDYTVEQVAGHEAVLTHGGEVRILDFVAGYSTSGTIRAVRER